MLHDTMPTGSLEESLRNLCANTTWYQYWHYQNMNTAGTEYDAALTISLTSGPDVIMFEQQFAQGEPYGALIMRVNSTAPESPRPNALYWRHGYTPVEGPAPRKLPDEGESLSEATLNYWDKCLGSPDLRPTLAKG